MKIFIDADGCPVVDIAIGICKDYQIDVVVVKNFAHKISDSYAEIVSVDIENDSADFYIVNRIQKGDIVITQDYGLASLCLSKHAFPINQNGLIYTQENIDGMLNTRHIHQQLRRAGKRHSNQKKRNTSADEKFKYNFKKLIEKVLS